MNTQDSIILSTDNYFNLEADLALEVKSIASEVFTLFTNLKRHNVKVAVEMGSKLHKAKTIFMNTRSIDLWQSWIEQELHQEISHDTVTNLINLYKLSEEYGEEYFKGISTLNLGALYAVARSSVEPAIKEKILEEAERVLEDKGEPLSKQEVTSLIKAYRKVKLANKGVNPDAIPLLAQSPLPEDPKQLEALSKLSQKKQLQVAEYLNTTQSNVSIKEALKNLKGGSPEPPNDFILSPIQTSSFISPGISGLKKVKSESVQVAFLEPPMSYEFVCGKDNSFKLLCTELNRILTPGGFALSVIGHKASIFTGPIISESHLSCAHILVLRRQPGHSRQIAGINIIAASVLVLFLYKPPFTHPRNMIADLYTFEDPEVINGIETALNRIFPPLIHPGDSFLHCTFSENNFSIRSALKDISNCNGCSSFIEVGP